MQHNLDQYLVNTLVSRLRLLDDEDNEDDDDDNDGLDDDDNYDEVDVIERKARHLTGEVYQEQPTSTKVHMLARSLALTHTRARMDVYGKGFSTPSRLSMKAPLHHGTKPGHFET